MRPVELVDLPLEVLPDRGEVIHLLNDLLNFTSEGQIGVRHHAFRTGDSRGVTNKMLEALAIEVLDMLLPSVLDVLAEDID